MSANMFDALSEDPVAPTKVAAAPAAAAPAKSAQKSLVGGTKKTDAPKASASSPQQVTKGRLPGEARKETNRGPRKQHAPRQDGEGRIRGREFDRHSATGRPAHSNDQRRGGAGRFNAGSLKDARADEEAAQVAATTESTTEGTEAKVEAVTEEVAATEIKAAEPEEPKTQSLAAFRAEQAKKTKDFEATLGTTSEVRVVKADWYKPAEKTAAAPAAASSSKAAPVAKQQKNFVPLSQVIGEKPQHRERDDRERRGPRREGSNTERPERTERTERTFNKAPRQNNNNTNNTRGPRKQKETFDATAASDRDFPALGH